MAALALLREGDPDATLGQASVVIMPPCEPEPRLAAIRKLTGRPCPRAPGPETPAEHRLLRLVVLELRPETHLFQPTLSAIVRRDDLDAGDEAELLSEVHHVAHGAEVTDALNAARERAIEEARAKAKAAQRA